jgi:hypothetical protein
MEKSAHVGDMDVPLPMARRELGFEGSGARLHGGVRISPQILKVGNGSDHAHPPRDKSQRTAEFMGMEVNGRYYSRGEELKVA